MDAHEQLDRVRKLVLDTKALIMRREQLLRTGSSLDEIDAEIGRNQAEYHELCDCLTPLVNQIWWDQLRNILFKFYYEAMPMREILTTVIDLPVSPSSLSFAQGRKKMAIRELQRVIDRQGSKK